MEHPFEDIIVIGDTQCGSIFGLWPEGYTLSDGGTWGLNPGQKYLWDTFNHLAWRLSAAARAGAINPTGLVFMGDAIDGRQRAQEATEAVTTRISDQVGAFATCMSTLRRVLPSMPLYMIQGTEYHDQKAGDALEGAAASLGAVEYGGVGSGKFSHEVLDLSINETIVNFSHHISALTGFYRATAIDKEALWSAIAGKDGKMPKADVIARAHVHYFIHIEHESKHAVVGPAWQLQTRFMRKNSVYRMLPSIGAYIIRIWKEKPWWDDKVEIKKMLYGLPPYQPYLHRHS